MRAKIVAFAAAQLIAVCGQALASGSHSQDANSSPAEKLMSACGKNDLQACVTLGMMHEAGLAPKASLGTAVEMYQKACDGENRTGCAALAMLHEERGQVGRARDLYGEACDKDDMYACARLGMLDHDEDPDQALRLWSEACENGEPLGCRLLGEHGASKQRQHIH